MGPDSREAKRHDPEQDPHCHDHHTGDLDALSALIGAVFYLDPFRLGIKGGYFFLDLHEWDAMPYAEVVVGRFSLGGEYKAFGKANWGAGYVKFRW